MLIHAFSTAVILVARVLRVVLYSRPGCRLCDDAKREFQKAVPEAEIEEVDVDSEPSVQALYGNHIPVAIHAGRELFRHRFDPECVRWLR